MMTSFILECRHQHCCWFMGCVNWLVLMNIADGGDECVLSSKPLAYSVYAERLTTQNLSNLGMQYLVKELISGVELIV